MYANLLIAGLATTVPLHPVAVDDSIIQIRPDSASILAGDTAAFVALDSRDNVRLTGVTWRSLDTTVVTVRSGLVAARRCCTTRVVASIMANGRLRADTALIRVTGSPVRAIFITPRDSFLIVGDTTRLSARARDDSNRTLYGHPVTWTSSNPAAVRAYPTGLLRAQLQVGSAWIRAQSRDSVPKRDSILVGVLSLAVVPESNVVSVRMSTRDTAVVRDSGGALFPSSPVTWRSLNASIASVNTTGVVIGLTPGVTRIVVTSRKSAGTLIRYSKTRVVAATADGAPVGECADSAGVQRGWLWCDTFETNRLARYFEYDSAAGRFVRDSGVGRNGSWGLRATFRPGFSSSGALKLGVGKTPAGLRSVGDTIKFHELYWRIYVRFDTGWSGGAGTRLLAATSLVNRRGAQAMSGYVWPGSTPPADKYVYIDPASGTDRAGNVRTLKYNDWANLRFLGTVRDSISPVDSLHVGTWSCLEGHVRLNDSTQANGLFELWVDDTLRARRSDLVWVGAAYQGFGVNAIVIDNAWRTGVLGSTSRSQSRTFDNFIVSTHRIFCRAAT